VPGKASALGAGSDIPKSAYWSEALPLVLAACWRAAAAASSAPLSRRCKSSAPARATASSLLSAARSSPAFSPAFFCHGQANTSCHVSQRMSNHQFVSRLALYDVSVEQYW
jgi:hypothetical protein